MDITVTYRNWWNTYKLRLCLFAVICLSKFESAEQFVTYFPSRTYLDGTNPICDFDAPLIKGHTNIMEFDWCLLRFQFLGKRDSLKLVNNQHERIWEKIISSIYFPKKLKLYHFVLIINHCACRKSITDRVAITSNQNLRFSSLYA